MYKYISIDLDRREGITDVTREFCKAFYRSRDEFIKSGGEKTFSLTALENICGGRNEMVREMKILEKYGYFGKSKTIGRTHIAYVFSDVGDVPKELKEARVKRNTKIVFIALAVYAQEKEIVKAPLEMLCRVIGLRRNTIDKHLKILDDCKIITRLEKDTYQINVWP